MTKDKITELKIFIEDDSFIVKYIVSEPGSKIGLGKIKKFDEMNNLLIWLSDNVSLPIQIEGIEDGLAAMAGCGLSIEDVTKNAKKFAGAGISIEESFENMTVTKPARTLRALLKKHKRLTMPGIAQMTMVVDPDSCYQSEGDHNFCYRFAGINTGSDDMYTKKQDISPEVEHRLNVIGDVALDILYEINEIINDPDDNDNLNLPDNIKRSVNAVIKLADNVE